MVALMPRCLLVSKVEEVSDQLSDLSESYCTDVHSDGLDYPINTDRGWQVGLGDTVAVNIDLSQPSAFGCRARHDQDSVLPEVEHVVAGDYDRRSHEPWFAAGRSSEVDGD